MTKIIPYREGHLDFITPLDCYKGDAQERVEAQCLGSNYTAFTLVADNAPIAVIGCVLTQRKVLSVWALAGKEILKYPVFYHRTLKNLIDGHVNELKIERVQSLVSADNERALDQHIRLGFEVEAKLLKSGPEGEDQYLLRKLING